jgi:predicted N-acetyltransferase YhbS
MPDDTVDALLDAAFGPDRFARTAYAIRRGMAVVPEYSFAVCDADVLIGTVQCWPIALKNEKHAAPLIMVGPVAVLPAHQGQGYGKMLMDAAMGAIEAVADAPLMMIGDPEYYGRFWGFCAKHTALWRAPGPVDAARLLARTVHNIALPASGMLGPRP